MASIWQLSFTAVTRIQEKKAAKVAAERAQQYVDANNVAAEVREFVLDSVANIRNRAYIDSISAEKVYLGYTYQSAKEKEINLGLDLKGGMNVMLQVQLQDLVKALAGNSTDPDFLKALELAKKNNVNSSQDFIGLFESAWAETANGRRLAEVFGTYELRDKVKPESTDKEVIEVIRKEGFRRRLEGDGGAPVGPPAPAHGFHHHGGQDHGLQWAGTAYRRPDGPAAPLYPGAVPRP